MDTITPPYSGTVNDSLANNVELTSTDAVITFQTNIISDEAKEDINM